MLNADLEAAEAVADAVLRKLEAKGVAAAGMVKTHMVAIAFISGALLGFIAGHVHP